MEIDAASGSDAALLDGAELNDGFELAESEAESVDDTVVNI